MKDLNSSKQPEENIPKAGPLVDFSGKKIKIDLKGIRTPVDASLTYKDGINVLELRFNLCFCDDVIPETEKFRKAVIEGIKEWEGCYSVFGNQKLEVKMFITTDTRLLDNVTVIPVTKDMIDHIQKTSAVLGNKKNAEFIEDRRSFAVCGIRKWSVRSRKTIFILSSDDKFDNFKEMKAVAKHEFGHVLGLGDLYESPADGLVGVENGKYKELDAYKLGEKKYYLVMCNQYGPVSNNDIEMVVLAFSRNEWQNYQPQNKNNKISEALGKGN